MKSILIIILMICTSYAYAEDTRLLEAKAYIEQHPKISKEKKEAITAGKIILGMCPNEAIAAAGRPGPYKIIKDKKWGSDVPPPIVAMKQCAEPDYSIVEFMFRNKLQFEGDELTVFRVRFEKGLAVIINKNDFSRE